MVSYTDCLRWVELELPCIATVDEQSPHHIWRWNGLNVLHHWQINLLAAAQATKDAFTLTVTRGSYFCKYF